MNSKESTVYPTPVPIDGKKRGNTQSFIAKANVVHNFKYDYSKVIYGRNNNVPVTLLLPFHMG